VNGHANAESKLNDMVAPGKLLNSIIYILKYNIFSDKRFSPF
jgi:hypothetical protein